MLGVAGMISVARKVFFYLLELLDRNQTCFESKIDLLLKRLPTKAREPRPDIGSNLERGEDMYLELCHWYFYESEGNELDSRYFNFNTKTLLAKKIPK